MTAVEATGVNLDNSLALLDVETGKWVKLDKNAVQPNATSRADITIQHVYQRVSAIEHAVPTTAVFSLIAKSSELLRNYSKFLIQPAIHELSRHPKYLDP